MARRRWRWSIAVWRYGSGGFGLGLWRSIYPNGPIWSFALGPVTIYLRLEDK